MFSSIQTWTIITITAIIWLALAFAGAVNGGPAVVTRLADYIPFLALGAAVCERWVWRWSKLHPNIVPKPVVIGTWRGDLESMWDTNPEHQRPPIKTVYLTIRQTYTTVSVRLLTDESESDQLIGSVAKTPFGNWVISYTYANNPDIRLREGSPPHTGGAALTIYGEPPTRIEGEYWTSRRSMGKLTMTARVSAIAPGYAEAKALFGA